MSAAHIDRISAGYALPFLEQIKYAIRSMPYGDLMELSTAALPMSEGNVNNIAKELWDWANAPLKNEKEQTKEERTSVSGGIYAP